MNRQDTSVPLRDGVSVQPVARGISSQPDHHVPGKSNGGCWSHNCVSFLEAIASPTQSQHFISFESLGPAAQAFPSWAAENGYQDITDNRNTPFQRGHNTTLSTFEYITQNPRLFGAMQTVMAAIQSSDWIVGLDVLDAAASAVAMDPNGHRQVGAERPFFVDVGGGQGHQCKQLLEKYPNLKGRLILQDLRQAVDELPPIEGVRVMAQNFFEPQAVQGGSFRLLTYLLFRSCLQPCIDDAVRCSLLLHASRLARLAG